MLLQLDILVATYVLWLQQHLLAWHHTYAVLRITHSSGGNHFCKLFFDLPGSLALAHALALTHTYARHVEAFLCSNNRV